MQAGDNSTLRIEVDDPAVQAIEFLVFDESQNKW
jgi:alpha-glucan, water dikinase